MQGVVEPTRNTAIDGKQKGYFVLALCPHPSFIIWLGSQKWDVRGIDYTKALQEFKMGWHLVIANGVHGQ